ncbi:MAG: carboxypeptidase-like regulatory domain-containing protein [Euryarchaeota archaeon]|nr:carboxypeptidase-like regulatory domain-containing protein [Euryarchaeota archaeon]
MARRPVALLAVALLLVLTALSGCLGDDDKPKPAVVADDPEAVAEPEEDPITPKWKDGEAPSVFGFVTDLARTPLPGVTVTAQSLEEPATTDADGYYHFYGLEAEKPHVLVAKHDGYITQSLRIVTHLDQVKQLDFTLEPEPVETPYTEEIPRVAVIGCQFTAIAGHDHGKEGQEVHQRCDNADTNAVSVLEFEVDPKAAGIIIEMKWDYATPLAEFMLAHAETKGYGDLDTELGEVIGPSILSIEVSQETIKRYYAGSGGQFRLTLEAHPEDDDEQAAGAAFHFQQRVDVLVTVFYIEPNPPGYSGFTTE